MRGLIAILAALLLMLQVRLWLGDGSVAEVVNLRHEVAAQRVENDGLRKRNAALEADVRDLKTGDDAVEERARRELGMVRDDETFYQVVNE